MVDAGSSVHSDSSHGQTRNDAAADDERTVLNLEFSLGDSGIEYKPGDSISFICPNDEAAVEAVLSRVQYESSACEMPLEEPDSPSGGSTFQRLLRGGTNTASTGSLSDGIRVGEQGCTDSNSVGVEGDEQEGASDEIDDEGRPMDTRSGKWQRTKPVVAYEGGGLRTRAMDQTSSTSSTSTREQGGGNDWRLWADIPFKAVVKDSPLPWAFDTKKPGRKSKTRKNNKVLSPFVQRVHQVQPFCTPRDALRKYCDVSSPVSLMKGSKGLLRMLAEYCADDEEKAVLLTLSGRSDQSRALTKVFLSDQRLSLAELLELFPSCTPPLTNLLSRLPELQPRAYSIASSDRKDPTVFAIAFNVVNYKLKCGGTNGGFEVSRGGLCTNWLHRLAAPMLKAARGSTPEALLAKFMKPNQSGSIAAPQSKSQAFLEKGKTQKLLAPVFKRTQCSTFRVPCCPSAPIIMIGPGTGVAPFIGFLQDRALHYEEKRRQALTAVCTGSWRGTFALSLVDDDGDLSMKCGEWGESHLFFGCRNQHKDWIYRDEMLSYQQQEPQLNLYTAFSRDQVQKVYVQHRMKEKGAMLWRLINEEAAYVFVCGDGMHMAQDVKQALIEIFRDHGEMSEAEAKAYLLELKSPAVRRFAEDVWG
jgi:sulfite reductase alpha subunit-like flavoprotein